MSAHSILKKAEIKYVQSLKNKKFRQNECAFVAEGIKLICDLIASGLVVERLYTTDCSPFPKLPQITEIAITDLSRISFQKTPNTAIAVFKIPEYKALVQQGLVVVLDGINDPGNLGTIIRLCDWFGVAHLVCSENSVDCYNTKVVQASMGALARVQVHYVNIYELLRVTRLPIFAAVLDGLDIRETDVPRDAMLVMGSEASGISPEVMTCIRNRVTIPRYSDRNTPESLNVATATAILLHEFRTAIQK